MYSASLPAWVFRSHYPSPLRPFGFWRCGRHGLPSWKTGLVPEKAAEVGAIEEGAAATLKVKTGLLVNLVAEVARVTKTGGVIAPAAAEVVVAVVAATTTPTLPPNPNDFFRCIFYPALGCTGLSRPVDRIGYLQWFLISWHQP